MSLIDVWANAEVGMLTEKNTTTAIDNDLAFISLILKENVTGSVGARCL